MTLFQIIHRQESYVYKYSWQSPTCKIKAMKIENEYKLETITWITLGWRESLKTL